MGAQGTVVGHRRQLCAGKTRSTSFIPAFPNAGSQLLRYLVVFHSKATLAYRVTGRACLLLF